MQAEKDIEHYLKREVESRGGMCIKFAPVGYTGLPDRIILFPDAYICFAELKKPGESERRRQKYVQSLLRRLGFKVYNTVDSYEKVNDIIKDYLLSGV